MVRFFFPFFSFFFPLFAYFLVFSITTSMVFFSELVSFCMKSPKPKPKKPPLFSFLFALVLESDGFFFFLFFHTFLPTPPKEDSQRWVACPQREQTLMRVQSARMSPQRRPPSRRRRLSLRRSPQRPSLQQTPRSLWFPSSFTLFFFAQRCVCFT